MRKRLSRAIKTLVAPIGDSSYNTVPRDADPRFGRLYEQCRPYTLTSVEKMYALWQATRYIHDAGVGDVVECGVWRGGSAMLAALTLREASDDRRAWLFDAFAGMSRPGAEDVDYRGVPAGDEWEQIQTDNTAGLNEVKANMSRIGTSAERAKYIVGDILQTVPGQAPNQIALLRLDTDWYESTRHELEHLWPRLEPGGVLIIDD